MTKKPPPKPQPEQWQRKRPFKWRDVYVKTRMAPSWKQYRKRQTWRT